MEVKIGGNHNTTSRPGGNIERQETKPAKIGRGEDALEISRGDVTKADAIYSPSHKVSVEDEMSASLDGVRARLQERIRNGFYDSDEVLHRIAGRILDGFGL